MEISVFNIAKTQLNNEEVLAWLEEVGCKSPDTILGSLPTDGSGVIGLAGKRCYNSFETGLNPNITKIRESWVEYFDNILESGHGSVMEHASWTWAIEGCTRVFTAEMNRHRAGVAISEGSMRYIRFKDTIPFWMPICLRENSDDSPEIYEKKRQSRVIFNEAFDAAFENYSKLLNVWKDEITGPFKDKKKITSMMRRIIPMGVSTGAVYTFNLRALRHIITLRTDPAAEEEICYVVGKIASKMVGSILGLQDFIQVDGFWQPKHRKV